MAPELEDSLQPGVGSNDGRHHRLQPRLEPLLQVLLDTTGAERVYVVSGADPQSRPSVDALSSLRSDGDPRPSATVLRQVQATRGTISLDGAGTSAALEDAASVRGMGLRTIVAAPIEGQAPVRRALVLDSRVTPRRPPGELESLVGAVAVLASQLIRAAPPDPSLRGPRSTPQVGDSAAFADTVAWARRVAKTRLPVLVAGETGSGKEGIARLMHEQSLRGGGPFVPVNCAAVTESLLEAELFGAVRGAYTGADRDRPGLFHMARGGTLFLDEVGDMPLTMQAMLLRVIEEEKVRPVGSARERPVDVRLIAATHRDLQQRIARGRFREDLYHRLAVLEVRLPPLRARTEDLPSIVSALAPRLVRETGRPIVRVAPETWPLLAAHAWPGNVRELYATLASALVRSDDGEIRPEHLHALPSAIDATPTRDGLEREMILSGLRACGGNVTRTADRIGWTRQKLYRRMQKLRL